tara:strand:- start:697 stop:1032 length:336 start_codon:yes stop_codon:yes gene_type:complete
MFKTNDLVANYTDEEFFQYVEKMSGSEKGLISLGFMMGQNTAVTKVHNFKFTLVTEMAGELGTEKITLAELITKFNHKVDNFGRMDTREDAVFTNEKDAANFIADGGGKEL